MLQGIRDKIFGSKDWFSSSNISYGDIHEPAPENFNHVAQWESLMRGQVMTVTTQKMFNYINVVDQKAQMIIILNSLIIPLALKAIQDPEFKIGGTISIAAGITSLMWAIICIYPKRRSGRKPDGTINHLHFGDIGQMTEQEYLSSFKPIFNDKTKLTEEVLKDIHDISRRILRPKFRALKASYIAFFLGNLVAIAYTVAHTWVNLF